MIYLDTPLDFFKRIFCNRWTAKANNYFSHVIRNKRFIKWDKGVRKYKSSITIRKPILKPLVNDDNVYQQIINKNLKSIKNTDSNIYKNYIYAKDRIKDLNNKGFSFNHILMAMDNLYLVCVPLSSNDNAQKIFESINSTGSKLTASDLIRNYILMTIPSEEQEIYYKNYWNEI